MPSDMDEDITKEAGTHGMDRRAFLKLAGTGAALCVLPLGTLAFLRNPSTSSSTSATATRSYTESSNYFPNPERGWYIPIDPNYYTNKTQAHEGETERPQPLTAEELQRRRAEGVTLVRKYYVLYDYRESDIPQSYLEEHPIHDLNLVRENGFKLIPRFIYVWNDTDFDDRDASVEWIVRHLDQLAPILREHYDVIAHFEIGLVGYWGEWHSSKSGNLGGTWTNRENGGVYNDNVLNQNSLTIINKALAALPSQRMAIIRYVHQIQQLYQDVFYRDLDERQAYNGGYQARIGFEDDSEMYNEVHRGGYHSNPEVRRDEREFQSEMTRYVPMVGEPSGDDGSGYIFKTDPLAEFEMMHWRAMNNGWHEAASAGIYDYWNEHGAYDEMSMRFGYRFSLVRAGHSEEVKPGEPFHLAFEVKNSGFGAPYNERLLEAVLRHAETREEYFLSLDEDPRRWWAGETVSVRASGLLPHDARPGDYEVFLNLPDPDLYGRPAYSIRLANDGVWEEYSGYNSLGGTVRVHGQNSLSHRLSVTGAAAVGFGVFEKREAVPEDDGSAAITIPSSGLISALAQEPELEENDVFVNFKDRPEADTPLADGHGGLRWEGDWHTAYDQWGKYVYIAGRGRKRRAVLRLPEGKVLKSFALLKYERDATINKLTLRSGAEEYVWENPTPWWAGHFPGGGWREFTGEIAVEVESDGRWGGGNLVFDNIVYGDSSDA